MSQLDLKTWKITFKGEVIEGFNSSIVKQKFGELFKLSEDKIERIFAGREVTIKRNLDRQQLTKYLAWFKKNGLRVYFYEEQQAPSLVEQEPPKNPLTTLSLVETEPTEQKPEIPASALSSGFFQSEAISNKNIHEPNQNLDDDEQNTAKPMSLVDRIDVLNDRDRAVSKPPILGISFEDRLDPVSYVCRTLLFSVIILFFSFLSVVMTYTLVLIVPCYLALIRVQVLRLHDMNLSGFWVLLYPVMNLLLALVYLEPGFETQTILHYLFFTLVNSAQPWQSLNLVAAAVNALLFLFMALKSGTSGENDFGSPVVDAKSDEAPILSPKLVAIISFAILCLSIVIFRPISANSQNNAPLSVEQLNKLKPQAGEFVTFDAHVAWHSPDCFCPADMVCLPCTDGVSILSDKHVEEMPVLEQFSLLTGRNKEETREYILFNGTPKDIKAGGKYRFTLYIRNGMGNYSFSKAVQEL